MLVLSRELGEDIIVSLPSGEVITIRLCALGKGWASIGVGAPKHILVDRAEVHRAKQRAAQQDNGTVAEESPHAPDEDFGQGVAGPQ